MSAIGRYVGLCRHTIRLDSRISISDLAPCEQNLSMSVRYWMEVSKQLLNRTIFGLQWDNTYHLTPLQTRYILCCHKYQEGNLRQEGHPDVNFEVCTRSLILDMPVFAFAPATSDSEGKSRIV
jgi:hypothetical protein